MRVLSNQILLKAIENDKSSNACQSFRINVKAVKLSGKILRLMYFSENNGPVKLIQWVKIALLFLHVMLNQL